MLLVALAGAVLLFAAIAAGYARATVQLRVMRVQRLARACEYAAHRGELAAQEGDLRAFVYFDIRATEAAEEAFAIAATKS